MKGFKGVLLCALALLTILLPHDSRADSLISPQLSVSPQTFPKGMKSSAFICITNQNPASKALLNRGDRFTLSPRQCGTPNSVSKVFTNSSDLTSSDFSAKLVTSGGAMNLVITYINSTPKQFAPGESFAVKLTISPPAQVATGTITFSGPPNAASRFAAPFPRYVPISSIDFPRVPTRVEVVKDVQNAGWSCYADAHCPAGMVVLGGGGTITYTPNTDKGALHYHLMQSYPTDASAWSAAWQCEGPGCTGSTTVQMKAFAICQ